MGKYIKKTNQRRYEDRTFSVRPVHRDSPDLHKLCEVLIRLTLEETGESRIARRAEQPPQTYRPARIEAPTTPGCPATPATTVE